MTAALRCLSGITGGLTAGNGKASRLAPKNPAIPGPASRGLGQTRANASPCNSKPCKPVYFPGYPSELAWLANRITAYSLDIGGFRVDNQADS